MSPSPARPSVHIRYSACASVAGWHATLNVVEVAFDDEAEAFENINTREELGRIDKVQD